MKPKPKLVDAQSISVARGKTLVLKEINVAVSPGDVVGLIGRNGAGKSTLLEALLGFHPLSRGRVNLWGTPTLELTGEQKQRIGFVSQRDDLLDGLTGAQQLELISAFYPRWDQDLAQRLISRWEIPTSRSIRTYSLGQRQRLAIIQALSARPRLLFLDEPVASLDPLARAEFLHQMRTFLDDLSDPSGERCALVISSHIVGDLQALVNKVWILESGQMRWQGPVDRIGDLVGGDGGRAVDLETVFRQLVG